MKRKKDACKAVKTRGVVPGSRDECSHIQKSKQDQGASTLNAQLRILCSGGNYEMLALLVVEAKPMRKNIVTNYVRTWPVIAAKGR